MRPNVPHSIELCSKEVTISIESGTLDRLQSKTVPKVGAKGVDIDIFGKAPGYVN